MVRILYFFQIACLASFFSLNALADEAPYVTDTDPGSNPGNAGCILQSSSPSCSSATIVYRDHCVYDSGMWKLNEYAAGAGCFDISWFNPTPTLYNCNTWCTNQGYARGSCIMVNVTACGTGAGDRVGKCSCKVN